MSEFIVIAVLGAVALGAVAYPILVGHSRYDDAADLDADVERYRAALDAGTVCPRCRSASPAGSRFCTECGGALADE